MPSPTFSRSTRLAEEMAMLREAMMRGDRSVKGFSEILWDARQKELADFHQHMPAWAGDHD